MVTGRPLARDGGDRLPEDREPHDRLPHDRLPDDRLPDDRERNRAPGRGRRRGAPTVAGAVVRFSVAGLAALALLAVGAVVVLHRTGTSEAVRDARQLTSVIGGGVVEPNLTPALLAGDDSEVARMDHIVTTLMAPVGVVRAKLWGPDGRILYSDEHRLIGSVFPLEADELAVLRGGGADAGLSDLSAPENRFERRNTKLLEVYVQVHGPSSEPLLFEAYLPFRSVAASGQRIWRQFAPIALGSLLLLELVQVPLAWSVAKKLRAGQEEREALLQRAIDSSDAERRRIARDLHDGVVQDLVGVSYALAAAVEGAASGGGQARDVGAGGDRSGGAGGAGTELAATLRQSAAVTRQSIRQLRTLLVDIYPPNLQAAGLEAALSDLLAPFTARGVEATLDCCHGLELTPAVEALVFRTVQEGLRNVISHADAGSVSVRVARHDGSVAVVVEDDGRGYSPETARSRAGEGHVGLRLLADLATDAGGTLQLWSEPGHGARVELTVPA